MLLEHVGLTSQVVFRRIGLFQKQKVWQQHTAVLDDNISQVCDEIFIDVHKLLRMCIGVKALHTINACFFGKHASRTCRFNHSSCISKNSLFQKQKVFAAFHFAFQFRKHQIFCNG